MLTYQQDSSPEMRFEPSNKIQASTFNSTPSNRNRYSGHLPAGVMQRKQPSCVFKAPGEGFGFDGQTFSWFGWLVGLNSQATMI